MKERRRGYRRGEVKRRKKGRERRKNKSKD